MALASISAATSSNSGPWQPIYIYYAVRPSTSLTCLYLPPLYICLIGHPTLHCLPMPHTPPQWLSQSFSSRWWWGTSGCGSGWPVTRSLCELCTESFWRPCEALWGLHKACEGVRLCQGWISLWGLGASNWLTSTPCQQWEEEEDRCHLGRWEVTKLGNINGV